MNLDMEFPQAWKAKSETLGIAISDVLYGYAVESLMLRIEKTSFYKDLWLSNTSALDQDAYGKIAKERLRFYYTRKPLEKAVAEKFATELLVDKSFDRDINITWNYDVNMKADAAFIQIEGCYQGMRIPVMLIMEAAPAKVQAPTVVELELEFYESKKCKVYCYSTESILAEQIFEILGKLELIGDMEVYDTTSQILQTTSINGRHIIEDLRRLGEKEPKMLSLKRLDQLKSYKDYTYMKRKWMQYQKRHGDVSESWEQVLTRVLEFVVPVWSALCENEIFFGDWMPELERFLE